MSILIAKENNKVVEFESSWSKSIMYTVQWDLNLFSQYAAVGYPVMEQKQSNPTVPLLRKKWKI